MEPSNVNDKTVSDMNRLIAVNGKDAAWASENFGQICAFLLNTRTAPSPVGALDSGD